jgi:hypothetical protein
MGIETIQATEKFVDVNYARTIKKIDVVYENPQDLVEYAAGFLEQGATHVSMGVDFEKNIAIVIPEWDHTKKGVKPPILKQPVKERLYRRRFKRLT